jgi:hypothetical protein
MSDKSDSKRRGFDSSADEQLHHIADVDAATKDQVIRISINSYNDGPPKLAMMRTGLLARSGERYYRSLGRLTLDEMVAVTLVLDGLMSRLAKAGVVDGDVASNKRFSKWLEKHGKPLPPESDEGEDDESDDDADEKPTKKSARKVDDEDDAADDDASDSSDDDDADEDDGSTADESDDDDDSDDDKKPAKRRVVDDDDSKPAKKKGGKKGKKAKRPLPQR